MDDTVAQAIRSELAQTALRLAPQVRLVLKYGGEVLCPDPSSDKAFVGGIFIYTDHVSLELSKGATLDDPAGHLEGKGKARRHLKLRSVSDIADKDAEGFLRQLL